MKIILATTTICASMIGVSSSAFADKDSDFEARLKALESKFEETSASLPAPLLKAFKTAKITGRLHVDAEFYDENSGLGDNRQDGFDITRARLGIQGKLSENFSYKFENDFAKNGSKIKDAFIAYDGLKNTQFKVGQFKQFFSLEELTSSNNITFMNRSAAVDAAPSRAVGLGVQTYGKNWQIAAGIFGESTGNESRSDDSKYSASIRASIAPVNSDGKLVHLGLAATTSSKDRDNSGTPEKIDRENLFGAEIALGLNSWSLQGEYIINKTNYDKDGSATTANQSTTYDSYYAQISYILTGENRVYQVKSGTFKGVKVEKPVGKNGGIGAWELAARFSKNDRNDDEGTLLIEGESSQITLGVNWYLNNNIRLMANYVQSSTEEKGQDDKDFDAFLLRAQINF
ncbi:MAG: phosphate-selective porin OprO/OprP [Lentimonas sp.]|jgi:phosphate-selective porin OprO/OprP